jgi:Ca-activated chloride channel homolog
VLPAEDLEVKVSTFYSKIRDPVLSDVSLSFTNPSVRVSRVMPSELPDLFNGDTLIVLGRYSGSGPAAVKISGTVNGTPRQFAADVQFPGASAAGEEDRGGSSVVPRLWAARRVGWLLDEMRLHGESGELKDEVIRLSRQFGIVTPYTAYLVLEDEAQRGVAENLRSFQELEEDKDASAGAKSRLDSVRREAASESSRAGAQAVENSLALQGLMSATVLPPAAPAEGLAKKAPGSPGQASLATQGYRASQSRNYAQQVRVVAGRAFYLNGTTWTDSTAQSQKGLKQKQVRIGSAEYFALARQSAQNAQWLALGANVDLVVDGTLVSVRE